jgi:hypothetical protein
LAAQVKLRKENKLRPPMLLEHRFWPSIRNDYEIAVLGGQPPTNLPLGETHSYNKKHHRMTGVDTSPVAGEATYS